MKKVKIEYKHWSAVVAIDYNDNTLKWMRDQLEYWTSATIDDDEVEDDYLRMLGQKLIQISTDGWNEGGAASIISESEGWAALDDRFGVKLLDMDNWKFVEEDFELTVL